MLASPSFESSTKIVARALGISSAELLAAPRPAVLADLPVVLALRRLEFGCSISWDDEAYLAWRYRLGRADCGLGELWVLFGAGELLGMIGTEDVVCVQAGRRSSGVRAMDILVDPRARNSGLGIWLNQMLCRRFAFALVVGSNTNSIGTLRRLFQLLPPRRRYTRYLDFRRYCQRRFGRGVAAWLGTQFANLVMRCWGRLTEMTCERSVEIRPILRFDASVDALVARSSVDPAEIGVERAATYLNRRLLDNPRAKYSVWGAYHEGEWRGYIAWRIVHREDGEIWLHIMDLQVDVGHRRLTLGALLAFTTRQAALGHCGFMEVMLQNDSYGDVLRRHGFRGPREEGFQLVTFYAADPSLLQALRSGRWSLTDLSSDGDGY